MFTSSKRQLPNLGEILKGILDEENIRKNLHHLTRNASINASVKNELHTRKQLTSDDKNLSVSNNKKTIVLIITVKWMSNPSESI